MTKEQILDRILDKKVIAVIRIKEEEKLKKVIEASVSHPPSPPKLILCQYLNPS